MGCEHTQAECSSELGCFGADKSESSTRWVLLWLETECSQRDAMHFITGQARVLAAQVKAAQPDDPSMLCTLRCVALIAGFAYISTLPADSEEGPFLQNLTGSMLPLATNEPVRASLGHESSE